MPGVSAVVVGGSSGLGRAVAEGLLEDGAEVAVVSRTASAVPVASAGREALRLDADVTDGTAMEEAFAAIRGRYGRIDVAVNAVGIVGRLVPVADADPGDLWEVLAVNVAGIHRAMIHEVPLMRESGGVIVNVSSTIGSHGVRAGMGAYAASKAALTTLSRTAAIELARQGIRVTLLSPGASDTPMSIRPGEDRAARDARMVESHPLGRVVALSEIVTAVRYLISPQAASTVGADLIVDGGQSV